MAEDPYEKADARCEAKALAEKTGKFRDRYFTECLNNAPTTLPPNKHKSAKFNTGSEYSSKTSSFAERICCITERDV